LAVAHAAAKLTGQPSTLRWWMLTIVPLSDYYDEISLTGDRMPTLVSIFRSFDYAFVAETFTEAFEWVLKFSTIYVAF
jgi:hypothetical protein